MGLGIAVLLVGVPLCAFFAWVANNGIRAQHAEWQARRALGLCCKGGDCRCCTEDART